MELLRSTTRSGPSVVECATMKMTAITTDPLAWDLAIPLFPAYMPRVTPVKDVAVNPEYETYSPEVPGASNRIPGAVSPVVLLTLIVVAPEVSGLSLIVVVTSVGAAFPTALNGGTAVIHRQGGVFPAINALSTCPAVAVLFTF